MKSFFKCHLFMYVKIRRNLRNRITFLNFELFYFLSEPKNFSAFYSKVQILQPYCIVMYFNTPTGPHKLKF